MSKTQSQQNGWREVRLGDIGDFFGGVTTIKKDDYGHGFPFLQYTNVYKNWKVNINNLELMNVKKSDLEKRNCIYGDIFFTASSETEDEVAMSSILLNDIKNLTYNGFCKRFRLHNFNILLPEFARYLFRSPKFRAEVYQYVTGDVRFNISQESLASAKVSLPPPPEQKAIAEVLSSLDDKIDLLHRQNKTLEDMAQALFRKWFIEGAKEYWEEKPLDKIADYLNGLACQKYPPENEIDRLPVLKIKELNNGISENSDWATTDVDPKYIVELGDVIFSWSGSLMLKIWDGQKCVLNQHLFKVTSEKSPKWFYYFWTKHHLEKFIGIADSKATTMGHIKRDDLSNSLVRVPNTEELLKMSERISPKFEKMILNCKQITNLEQQRDVLLPKLMNGKVRVKFN